MREIRRAWQFADIVFVGTFVSRDVTSSTLTVEKMWKGVSVEHATMREKTLLPDGLLTMSSCTQTFSSGRHLVFARQVDEGQWESGNCGPGGFAESRVEAIEFLDALCRDERLCALPVVDPSPPANADPDRRQ